MRVASWTQGSSAFAIENSDHRLERLEGTYPHHVPRRLGLEDHRLLREGVDALALLGRRHPLDRDAHPAGHIEDRGATLGEVCSDHRRHDVNPGSHVAAVNADVLGDGVEDLALAAWFRRGT